MEAPPLFITNSSQDLEHQCQQLLLFVKIRMHMDKAYILQLVKTLAKAQQALATEVGPETEDWEAKPEKVEQHPDALGLRDELAGEV
ncbi:hypothetical protein SMACR_01236 [Sordaria macrospora]|uniref:WGS project CABT00000000 data, contig 2.4 n=2 Tax=Sordaria macrospora TaxID=5147 RepID=F7VQ87_SORMK|nr:uncharacterized protein SMAC_01236 [Sordaria macrospora k-hell]KAA8630410.1 hypothetical protein SMACR_01236 [Sordaria macrospora]WPJ58884.1 hypothetical protein SMAC4_01236 [Sordaria macrospora]CCC07669.1 unnamed protein product [Sordaria macrospora k-hell]